MSLRAATHTTVTKAELPLHIVKNQRRDEMILLSVVSILVVATVCYVAGTGSPLCSPKVASLHDQQQEADVVVASFISRIGARASTCPDGVTVCDDDNTCCKLLSGNWGCCGLKEATCCTDRNSCCVKGALCCPGRGCCSPSLKCCPGGGCCNKEGTCCDDGACCPKGTSCCADGGCCTTGTTCCGEFCCNALAPKCCNGKECCNGECCTPSGCCSPGYKCCNTPDGGCCQDFNQCCGTGCCPKQFTCCTQYDRCCPTDFPICCPKTCCPAGSYCCGDSCCMGGGQVITSSTGTIPYPFKPKN